MIANLDRVRQRRLAIAILVVLTATLLSIVTVPIWAANASRNAALADGIERLQRYEQIAARDKELLPQYEAMIRKQKSAGNHLRSDTPAVAGAELQRLVKTITSRNKAQIVSTQILPVSEEQGFVRVALTVRLQGTLPAVLQSFHDIESNDVPFPEHPAKKTHNVVGRSQFKVQLRPIDAEFDLIAYMPETS